MILCLLMPCALRDDFIIWHPKFGLGRKELTRHAIREGGRLGMDIGLFNCSGFSSLDDYLQIE